MLREARMADLRKLRRGIGHIGQRRLWVDSDRDSFLHMRKASILAVVGQGLSYAERGSRGRKEPLPATPFMAGSGGGWIVKGLVFKDRQRV